MRTVRPLPFCGARSDPANVDPASSQPTSGEPGALQSLPDRSHAAQELPRKPRAMVLEHERHGSLIDGIRLFGDPRPFRRLPSGRVEAARDSERRQDRGMVPQKAAQRPKNQVGSKGQRGGDSRRRQRAVVFSVRNPASGIPQERGAVGSGSGAPAPAVDRVSAMPPRIPPSVLALDENRPPRVLGVVAALLACIRRSRRGSRSTHARTGG